MRAALLSREADPAAVAEVDAAVDAGSEASTELLCCRRDCAPFWGHVSVTPARPRPQRTVMACRRAQGAALLSQLGPADGTSAHCVCKLLCMWAHASRKANREQQARPDFTQQPKQRQARS